MTTHAMHALHARRIRPWLEVQPCHRDSVKPPPCVVDKNVISECLTAAEKWLAINNLKLKSNKTQCIIFSRKSSKSAIAFSKAST